MFPRQPGRAGGPRGRTRPPRACRGGARRGCTLRLGSTASKETRAKSVDERGYGARGGAQTR